MPTVVSGIAAEPPLRIVMTLSIGVPTCWKPNAPVVERKNGTGGVANLPVMSKPVWLCVPPKCWRLSEGHPAR